MMALDFSRVPAINYMHLFLSLTEGLMKRLGSLPRSRDRARNAIRFAWFAGQDKGVLHCSDDELRHLREGFLRAALVELSSIEDILRLDLEDFIAGTPVLKLNDTTRPHLHLFRELRHHEIHLRDSKLIRHQKEMLWGNVTKPEEATPITTKIWILEGVTVESFSELKNARHYSRADLTRLIDWFNAAQLEWGIQELFLRTTEDYCEELAVAYCGQPI
jgi:hypothetical protein